MISFLKENLLRVKIIRFARRAGFSRFFINIFFQRVLRKNSHADFQVNFASTYVDPKKIKFHRDDLATLLSFAVSEGVYIQAVNGVEIGRNFLMGPGVKIISANHDFDARSSSTRNPPVVIGNNVWIGANAIILPGVFIADGCVIGAGSVVTKSICESNSLVVGNPAKFIRRL